MFLINNKKGIMRINWIFRIWIVTVMCSCVSTEKKLPFLGTAIVKGTDTIYPMIPDFTFINQDSQLVSQQTFAGKIYVADFIFLSCPTICPRMTKEMKEVYASYATENRVLFLSHTIDPLRDTVARLHQYADQLGVKTNKWHFVTGNQDSIMEIAEKFYFSAAFPDSTSPGGFTHSGALLLIDQDRHIRGVYNGTEPRDTKRLINDIRLLLKEEPFIK